MKFRKNLATLGLAGLLALTGCQQDERTQKIEEAYNNTCLLNDHNVRPIKIDIDGKPLLVNFMDYDSLGSWLPCLSYDLGETRICYGTQDEGEPVVTRVYRNSHQITDPEVVKKAEQYSLRVQNEVLRKQRDLINQRINSVRRDVGIRAEKDLTSN
jgi:hypothetical protein